MRTIENHDVKIFTDNVEEKAIGRTYALDRIYGILTTSQRFDYPKAFNPQEYFHSSFGIIVDEDCGIERVRLKVYDNQYKYLRALPLHSSQQEVETTSEYVVFEYLLRPTYDFKQEILAHGEDYEILSPLSLRDEIRDMMERMCARYH